MKAIQSTGPTFPHRTVVIPAGYDKTVLRALPCNPEQLFVYWELPHTASPCISLTLSLFEQTTDATSEKKPVLNLPVTPETRNCYISVPVPGCSYTVTLKAAFADNNLITLTNSDTVSLPQPTPSPQTPARRVITPLRNESAPAPDKHAPVYESRETTTTLSPSSWTLQGHTPS
jgi:hypothetical protein